MGLREGSGSFRILKEKYYMNENNEPLSISKWARNERLLDTLLKMGLVVIPIRTDDESRDIDYFIVSSGMPQYIVNQEQDQG